MGISNQLIAALQDSALYKHEVSAISVIETHISWVLLTGKYAYKIKKPVKYSFVDFSTLEKRKFFCYEELRLNRRLAPNMYLDVVAIYGSLEHPSFSKSNVVIEYAVKMQQFSQQSLLDYLSAHDQLLKQYIEDMAKEIAEFHIAIDKATQPGEFGSPQDIKFWVNDNFQQIENNLEDDAALTSLIKIKNWSEREFNKKYSDLQNRKDNGFIRECHGDMHLGNMVLIENKVTIFDGIEFNDHLRWIDVISEVAFVMMDLVNRGHSGFAYRFINLYLQYTGDYDGLIVFNYYIVYRSLVRAKVALLRITQKHLSKQQESQISKEFKLYVDLASSYLVEKKVALIITNGLSGSGKSTYSESLLDVFSAIWIRSDIERKRLHGLTASAHTQSDINKNIYSKQSSKETYAQLLKLSRIIIDSGYSVIVDACFLHQEQRDNFRILASELNVPFIILEFQATEEELKKRIIARAKDKNEPSEADINVLEYQLKTYIPLDEEEKLHTIVINTTEKYKVEELVKDINSRM